MPRNKIIPYHPDMRAIARQLRKNMTLSEILLWKNIQNKKLGVQFHRQVPMNRFVVGFYCHELMLAIEVDGSSHDHSGAVDSDQNRQYTLEQYGVRFVRIQDDEVKKNLDGVIQYLSFIVDEIRKQK